MSQSKLSARSRDFATYHLRQASRRNNVSRVDQTVEMPRTLLNLLPHVVIHLHVKHIGDKVQRILVILDFSIQACQIEAVCQVVLIDLAEVLVAS